MSKFRVGGKRHIEGELKKAWKYGIGFPDSKSKKVIVGPADGWELEAGVHRTRLGEHHDRERE